LLDVQDAGERRRRESVLSGVERGVGDWRFARITGENLGYRQRTNRSRLDDRAGHDSDEECQNGQFSHARIVGRSPLRRVRKSDLAMLNCDIASLRGIHHPWAGRFGLPSSWFRSSR